MTYSANMLPEIQSANPRAFWAIKGVLPSGTKRYTHVSRYLSSLSEGPYLPKVLAWGDLDRAVSDDDDQLQGLDYEIEIDDTDRTFATMIARGEAVKGSLWTLYLVAPSSVLSSQSDWTTFFVGKLESYSKHEMTFRLHFRNDDRGLSRPVPVGVVEALTFPNADPDEVGKVLPVVLGKHSSAGIGNNGILPALYIDTSNGALSSLASGYKYLASVGRIEITDVFVGGVVQNSGYTVQYLWLYGRQYTLIVFTAAQTDDVTFDADGITDGDTGGETLADDAVTNAQMLLADWAFSPNEYHGGPFTVGLPDAMDQSSWDDLSGILFARSSRYMDQLQTVERYFSEWCQSFGVKAWYTLANKLAVALDRVAPDLDQYAVTWWRNQYDIIGDPEVDWPDDDTVASLTVDESSKTTIEVIDPRSPSEGKSDVLQRPWASNWIARSPAGWNGIPTPSSMYEADALDGNDGDLISSWQSIYGGSSATTFTAAGVARPTLRRNVVNGWSALEFDGVNDVMAGGLLSALIAAGAFTFCAVLRAMSASTTSATTSLNDAVLADTSSRFGLYIKDVAGEYSLHLMNHDGGEDTVAPTPPGITASEPVDDAFATVWGMHSGGTLYSGWDEYRTRNLQSTASGNTSLLTGTLRLGANGGGTQFAHMQIAALYIWNSALTQDQRALVHNYLVHGKYWRPNAWVGQPTLPHEDAREVGSRKLHSRREPRMAVRVPAKMHTLENDLMSIVGLSHPKIPDARGAGATADTWGRRLFRIVKQTIHLDAMNVTHVLQDLRRVAHLYHDGGISGATVDDAYGGPKSGLMVASPVFHHRTFLRVSSGSAAWAMNRAGRVQLLNQHVEKFAHRRVSATEIEPRGLLIESLGANRISRSSFLSGTTGLVLNGTGVNGSAINAATADPRLFEDHSGGWTFSWLSIRGGSPHAADLYARFPATAALPTGTPIWVSIDYRAGAGYDQPRFRLQRASDSQYWNATTGLWQAGVKWNAIGSSTYIDRAFFKVTHSVVTTYTLDIGFESGVIALSSAAIFHAQLEIADCPHSRMVNDGAVTACNEDTLTVSSWTDRKLWIEDVGTGALTFEPLWNTAELATNKGILELYNGAGQSFEIYYDYANTRFCFRLAGSSAQEARVSGTLVRGTQYRLAWRWLSASGEYGNTARTLSIWLDGVKGTDATGSLLTASATALLRVGRVTASVTADRADGYFSSKLLLRQALSDEECAYL